MTTGDIQADGQPSPTAPALHFCYASPKDYMAKELAQGDILKRTPELDEVLKAVHPHFHQHNKNLYFMVLTQSCDLVLRDGESGKAPYINVAPVRPLEEVISREVANLQLPSIRGELPLLTYKAQGKLKDFTRRVINNNAPQYFFLESEGTPLGIDCCAFLRLSIAIKSDLHYRTCVAAKILQLNDSFQAKLGSLVGQLYARVGTKDWEPRALEAKVSVLTKHVAHYLDETKVKQLEGKFAEHCAVDPNYVMGPRDLTRALKGIPTKKKVVVNRAVDVAVECLKLDEKGKQRLYSLLIADQALNAELGGQ